MTLVLRSEPSLLRCDVENMNINGLNNVICRLPIEVAQRAIAFLTIDDVVRLDSAAMIHDNRSILQDLYRGVVLRCADDVLICSSSANWLRSRNVFLARICISRSLVDSWSDILCILRDVESLRFESQSQVTGISMYEFFAHCPRLTAVVFKDCRYNGLTLHALATKCPLLQELNLCMSNAHASNLTLLVQYARCLTSINLASCLIVNNATIETICTHCTSLTSFNASGCTQLTGASVNTVASHCPGLQHLNMLGWTNITDECMMGLAAGCRSLQALHFGGCPFTTSATLQAIAANCSKLEDITLSYSSNVLVTAIVALIRGLALLKSYSGYVTDAVLLALAQSRRLETLKVSRIANSLSGEAVSQVVLNCASLQHLVLMRCDPLPPCAARMNSGLQVLNLGWCYQRTDKEVISLIMLSPQLRELHLFCCSRLGDSTVLAVAENCPHLQTVEFAGLKLVTDKSVVTLAQSCPALQRVNLSGCVNTDKAVVSIAQHCSQLTYLNIRILETNESPLARIIDVVRGLHCGDASIDALALHCKRLRELRVGGHPRISKAALDTLAVVLPKCKVYRS